MQLHDWLQDALCRGKNADFWFPPMEEANQTPYYRIGKSLCYRCPVWKSCLLYAQDTNEVWGCWGGLTPQERRNPHKVSHGTGEKYRLGCRCKDCKEVSSHNRPQLNNDNFPLMGESYDIHNLMFLLSSG